MKTNIAKKVAGTLVLVMALAAVAALNAGEVFARFIDTSSRVISDVVVLDIDSDGLLVQAEGTEPFEVGIDNRTIFSPRLGAINPGDIVDINATSRGGTLVAR